MSELSTVSETLYIPLLGRIYASRHHPGILYDKAVLAIADQLPESVREMPGQTEYTSLASAVRSKNVDDHIRAFLSGNPDCVIVNVGCGLETVYSRCDNGKALWFELDLPEVLELRRGYFPEEERDCYLPYSIFDYAWLDIVKAAGCKPVMVIASGLFLYFSEEQVIDFIKHLAELPYMQLIFDTVSPAGLKISRRYVRKMGKQNAEMFFSVGNAGTFAAKISPGTTVEERKFYRLAALDRDLKFTTKFKMVFSDVFNMVKMVHLKVNMDGNRAIEYKNSQDR